MEVEVNKSRNSLSDRMKGSNNGAAKVIGFVDFREEIEGGGARIRDMKDKDETYQNRGSHLGSEWFLIVVSNGVEMTFKMRIILCFSHYNYFTFLNASLYYTNFQFFLNVSCILDPPAIFFTAKCPGMQ